MLKTFAIVFSTLSCVGIAGAAEFEKLYDYYFPKGGEYLNSTYRRSFDETLSAPSPSPSWSRRERQHYYAFHGNTAAFHQFLRNPDAGEQGEPGENWIQECVLLLLKLGDDRFSELVAKEDPQTRKAVGYAIDPQIDWNKHQFPKTRALYSYRYKCLTQRELDERNRVPIVTGPGLTPEQIGRLNLALQKESRFSRVYVDSTNQFGGSTSIVAPKLMSKKDKADLQRLVRRQIGRNKSMTYERL